MSDALVAGLWEMLEPRFEEYRRELQVPHAVVSESDLHECYATISDGIGNQSIIISRRRANGDIVMMSVAINDIHGIIDCFGFYALSAYDFNKITEVIINVEDLEEVALLDNEKAMDRKTWTFALASVAGCAV